MNDGSNLTRGETGGRHGCTISPLLAGKIGWTEIAGVIEVAS